jgi:hypothetical protein
MKLHLTYFGDNNFSLGKTRIRKQAENFGVFDSILEFGESDLEDNLFWEQYAKSMMDPRVGMPGRYYGYYACKPYFILKALESIPENDVLLYVDSGCELNKNGLDKLHQYYEECLETEGVFFTLDLPEIQWTKMDTYRHIIGDNDEYLMTRQVISGIFFLKNTSMIRELVQKWTDMCVEDNGKYLDDSPSVLQNDNIFRENRHDQSIWSLLLKKKAETHDFTFHEDDTYETIWNAAGTSGVPVGQQQAKIWNTYGREYPIWATRNGQIDFTNCEA